MPDDPRARTSAICLTLPEAEREDSGRHSTFRVRGRTFAYFLDDHHGDGIVGVVFKVPAGMNEGLAGGEPDRFYMPAYIAHRGWLGLRLDTGRTDWGEVEDLVGESYALVAPKRLARMLEET
jgi:predicted DNA-binding protein (MmcQ/YjbR family)